jgi:HK97 family phage major capsid protein
MDLMSLAAVRRARAALDLIDANAQPLPSVFSFARLLEGMAHGGARGFEREQLEEVASRAGRPFDSVRPFVPFELLTNSRDLTAAAANGAGYLIDTSTLAAQDILRAYSVTGRLGITVTAGLTANAEMPVTSSKATAYWLSTETTDTTESTPALRSLPLTPKTAAALLEFSRAFSRQPQAESFVRRELLNTVGDAVDLAVIAGTGSAGQPLGIINATGINTQSGSSLAHTGVSAMKQKVATANAPDEGIAFIGAPAVRELLEGRERATGSGYIWDGDRVASRPATVSTAVPAATLICAHWPSIHALLWGPGFQLEVNPYDSEGFKSGKLQARVLVSCDVAASHPATICVASSIS